MDSPTTLAAHRESGELLTTWEALVAELERELQATAGQLGKQCNLAVFASHAAGAMDQGQFRSVVVPLLSCVIHDGVERPLQRRAAKKAAAAQVAVTIDCINDWFFVRVNDDGAQVRNETIYAVGSELSTEVSRLLATGGHFSVERSSARGMSYTFSWERRDPQLLALSDHNGQGSSESAA